MITQVFVGPLNIMLYRLFVMGWVLLGCLDAAYATSHSDDTLTFPAQLDLPTALRLFEARGFDLLIADAAIEGAQYGLTAAKALSNPQVSGSIGRSSCHESVCQATAYNVGLSDSAAFFDWLVGKRGLRIDIAQAALQAARQAKQDTERSVRTVVKTQYLAVAIDVANLLFNQQVMQSFAKTAELFQARYHAGAVSEADLVRVETDSWTARQQVDAAQEQLAIDMAGLAFLLGARGYPPSFTVNATWLEQAAKTSVDKLSVEDLITTAKKQRPDLLSQAYQRDAAEMALKLARRESFFDIDLNIGYQQQGQGGSAIQPPTWSLGLSLTLPVFQQYQGLIGQAQAYWRSQVIAYEKLEAQVVSDVSAGYATYLASRRIVEMSREQIRPRAARAYHLVQLQYQKGAASLLDLLDAQRTFVSVNQNYFSNMSDYWTSLFRLEAALATEMMAL